MSAPPFGAPVTPARSLADVWRDIHDLEDQIANKEDERDDLGRELNELEDELAARYDEERSINLMLDASASAHADGSFPDPPFGAPLTPVPWPYNDEVQS